MTRQPFQSSHDRDRRFPVLTGIDLSLHWILTLTLVLCVLGLLVTYLAGWIDFPSLFARGIGFFKRIV